MEDKLIDLLLKIKNTKPSKKKERNYEFTSDISSETALGVAIIIVAALFGLVMSLFVVIGSIL